ncbi:MAG: TIGR04168 family protein [Leptolyngbyaceae bacterium]|nr:TIGR04168 family protein [Leptolyngbyaceae bacterium]
MPKTSITIAVIGDVHDQWEAEDAEALRHLNIDLALFVGDFGNESVEIVEAIAHYDGPKAIILGNHDAWYNATGWGRAKAPYNLRADNRVRKQLDVLGDTHVGYGKLDFPQLGLTVVGGRPFSWGGPDWRNKTFYRQWYGVENFEQSLEKMKAAVDDAAHDTLIFIGHTGPTGLGDRPEDICGRDWNPTGGDFGDPDLAGAIAYARSIGKSVPLVTFGHMHHALRHTKKRLREQIVIDEAQTVNLNAARVPRIVENHGEKVRNFSFVTLTNGIVTKASLGWVNADHYIQVEHVLYETQKTVESLSC